MCGICGSTQDPEGRRVAAMAALMVHRGPDDAGVHLDPSGLALGVRRLSIVDVAGGAQPVGNEDGSVRAILNGEIYNHRSLRATLRERGHVFATESDTEVLVHLYEDYGAELVHALDGMFAFAVWDEPAGRLLLARDRFGEKPLFYAEHGGELTFASELTALAAGDGRSVELDPEQVDAYFVYGYVPGPGTIARGATQLPPGHLLQWSTRQRRAEVRGYWAPPAPRSIPSRDALPELIAETGRLLDGAVRTRLDADVPVGLMISGGIDSTVMAALAVRTSRRAVRTYTIGYDVGSVDETAEAREVAELLGTEHREIRLTAAEVASQVPSVLSRLDQPIADQALVSHEAICRHARQDVKVLVCGDGADEVFGGYPRYRWIERGEQLGRILPAPVGRRARAAVAGLAPGGPWDRLGHVLGTEPLLERHVDWVTSRRRELRASLYGPRLSRVAHAGVLSSVQQRTASHDGTTAAGSLMRLDQLHWLPDDVLVKADRASMLASVESRTPYLRHELAEFLAAVDTHTHLGRGGKRLLRGLAAELVPSISQRRPKRAFRVPAAEWLRGPLAPTLHRLVGEGTIFSEGWFARDAVRAMVDDHVAGRHDHSQALWPIMAFGVWHDRLVGDHG
jgi:asparagine synthase (glutamine-hydrolysing)